MYACLVVGAGSHGEALLDLALEFSPYVEQADEATVLFCIDPLRKLLGSPFQIASDISRAGYERKMQANLAIASNPDTAVLLARFYHGVTLATPGEEAHKLGPLPLAILFNNTRKTGTVSSVPPKEATSVSAEWRQASVPFALADAAMLDILLRWGVKTCEDLAALPEAGVAERLGPGGVYLRNLARGVIHRPLRVQAETSNYERRLELEHPIALLEPLLFLFSAALTEICALLRSQSRAARLLEVNLTLEEKPAYRAALEFPVPVTDHRTMLKLLQLHLERHSPEAQITAFYLRVEPVAPRRVQGGLFLPATPVPDKLQITLARIAGMVGEENVGAPFRLNTHRPDAFRLAALNLQPPSFDELATDTSPQGEVLRLVIRIFRPALEARVRLVELAPKVVQASGVKGDVVRAAGPWKTSGEWWAETAWSREEWDVALDDGGLYRIYQESQTQHWFVQGIYD